MAEARTIRFKSLTRDDAGYTWEDHMHSNDNGFFRSPATCLHPYLNEFKHYGDGNTPHTPGWAVGVDNALDCLASLAKHLIDNPADVSEVARRWIDPIDEHSDTIKFFARLKYDADKPAAYYNISDMKVSRSESKRHDKRWEAVGSWADGGLWAVFGFMVKSHWGFCERFHLYRVVRRALDFAWADDDDIKKYLGISDPDNRLKNNIESAMYIIGALVQAHRLKDHASSSWSCLAHNAGLNQPEELAA